MFVDIIRQLKQHITLWYDTNFFIIRHHYKWEWNVIYFPALLPGISDLQVPIILVSILPLVYLLWSESSSRTNKIPTGGSILYDGPSSLGRVWTTNLSSITDRCLTTTPIQFIIIYAYNVHNEIIMKAMLLPSGKNQKEYFHSFPVHSEWYPHHVAWDIFPPVGHSRLASHNWTYSSFPESNYSIASLIDPQSFGSVAAIGTGRKNVREHVYQWYCGNDWDLCFIISHVEYSLELI